MAARMVQVHNVFIQFRQHNLRKLLFPSCCGTVQLLGPLPGGGQQGTPGGARGVATLRHPAAYVSVASQGPFVLWWRPAE